MKQPYAERMMGPERPAGSDSGKPRTETSDPDLTNRDAREESIETGTDVDRVSGLDEVNTSTKQVDNKRERHPERDEHGRL